MCDRFYCLSGSFILMVEISSHSTSLAFLFPFYLFLKFLGAVWCLWAGSNKKPKAAGPEHGCPNTDHPFKTINLQRVLPAGCCFCASIKPNSRQKHCGCGCKQPPSAIGPPLNKFLEHLQLVQETARGRSWGFANTQSRLQWLSVQTGTDLKESLLYQSSQSFKFSLQLFKLH